MKYSPAAALPAAVYYHFPEGRNQILTEALQFAGDSITALIDEAVGTGRESALWYASSSSSGDGTLADDGFSAGCPVVAAAIGSSDEDPGTERTSQAGLSRRRGPH